MSRQRSQNQRCQVCCNRRDEGVDCHFTTNSIVERCKISKIYDKYKEIEGRLDKVKEIFNKDVTNKILLQPDLEKKLVDGYTSVLLRIEWNKYLDYTKNCHMCDANNRNHHDATDIRDKAIDRAIEIYIFSLNLPREEHNKLKQRILQNANIKAQQIMRDINTRCVNIYENEERRLEKEQTDTRNIVDDPNDVINYKIAEKFKQNDNFFKSIQNKEDTIYYEIQRQIESKRIDEHDKISINKAIDQIASTKENGIVEILEIYKNFITDLKDLIYSAQQQIIYNNMIEDEIGEEEKLNSGKNARIKEIEERRRIYKISLDRLLNRDFLSESPQRIKIIKMEEHANIIKAIRACKRILHENLEIIRNFK